MRHLADFVIRLFVCGFLGTGLFAEAASGGDAPAHKAAQKIDPGCISQELKIWAIVEKYENDQLQSSSMLVDVGTLLQDAKAICARGDVQSAMTIYISTLHDLMDHIHQLEIQRAD